MEKEKVIEIVKRLKEEGEKIKRTPDSRLPQKSINPFLDRGLVVGWKTKCESLILKTEGKDSPYYQNFIQEIKKPYTPTTVEKGLKILDAIEENIELSWQKKVNKWWKFTHPVWWAWIVIVFIFRDGLWKLLRLAWKYKVISFVISFVVAIVVGLVINYLSHKFGLNK